MSNDREYNSINKFIAGLTKEQREQVSQLLGADTQIPMSEDVKPSSESEIYLEQDDQRPLPKSKPRSEFQMNDESDNKYTKSPVPKMASLWVDTGFEHKDVVSKSGEKVDRTRPKFKRVEKICSICGDKEMAYPDISYGKRYRCNNCLGG